MDISRYIKLLKEENNQLVAKNIEYDSMILSKSKGTLEQVKKKSDLERTILTLRSKRTYLEKKLFLKF